MVLATIACVDDSPESNLDVSDFVHLFRKGLYISALPTAAFKTRCFFQVSSRACDVVFYSLS